MPRERTRRRPQSAASAAQWQPPPLPRTWLPCPVPAGAPATQSSVRVLSWNLLADTLCREHRRELYPDQSWQVLDGKCRLDAATDEIVRHKPTLACLQEVDNDASLRSRLEPHGYDVAFARRTGGRADGCALVWRRDAATPVEPVFSLNMRDLGLKDNVLQLATFALRHTQRLLCVANTHVLFNPKRGDVKLAQVRVACDALAALAKRHNNAPALFCGDFNATPGSPLHTFAVGGALDVARVRRKDVSGQLVPSGSSPSPETAVPNEPWTAAAARNGWDDADSLARALNGAPDGVARHALADAPLRSAYAAAGAGGLHGEAPWTSAHRKFFGTCDYVLYTPPLVATRVLLPPDARSLQPGAGGSLLPNRRWPSDHVSLVAEFAM